MSFRGFAIQLGQSTGFVWDLPVFSEVLICLSVHKHKFKLFGVVLCVLIIHSDNLRSIVFEILDGIVETGSIDHTKTGPNYFHQYFRNNYYHYY